MSLRKIVAKQLARRARKRINKWAENPIETQQRVFEQLIQKAKHTDFGKAHGFDQIQNHKDFIKRVPIADYEGLRPYVDRVVAGEADVLWPGKPLYFAKTSGTTSGTKYIPLTKESMPTHIEAAKNALSPCALMRAPAMHLICQRYGTMVRSLEKPPLGLGAIG